jgi:hypothetical protein
LHWREGGRASIEGSPLWRFVVDLWAREGKAYWFETSDADDYPYDVREAPRAMRVQITKKLIMERGE